MAKTKAQKQAYNQMLSDAYDQIAGALGKQSATPTQTTNQQSNTYTPTLSKDEVGKMYDDYMASLNSQNNTPSIPKLEDMGQNNSAPSTSVSLPNLSDLRSQLADTTTNRTEGETKALQDYIQGIETLQQNTYKQNYNDEINKVRNRLDTDVNLTDGERKANEEYLSGLQTLQAEIDRYNRPKYTPNNASNNTSTNNNTKQKKSKYEGKNVRIATDEQDKQIDENDIVEINGNLYTKKGLEEWRASNRERARENKLLKAENDTNKGLYVKYTTAQKNQLNNAIKYAKEQIKASEKEAENKRELAEKRQLMVQEKKSPFRDENAHNYLTEEDKKTEMKVSDVNDWMNKRYAASMQVGNNKYVYNQAREDFVKSENLKTEDNLDTMMQFYLDMDDHSKQVIGQDYAESKASKGEAPNRDIYLNKLLEDNPGMSYNTAKYFLDNADKLVDAEENNNEYMVNYLQNKVASGKKLTNYDESRIDKYVNDASKKYGWILDVGTRRNVFEYMDVWGSADTEGKDSRLAKELEEEYGVSPEDYEYIRELWRLRTRTSEFKALEKGFFDAIPFMSIVMDDVSERDEYTRLLKSAQEQSPISSGVGRLTGEAIKYYTMGKLLDLIPSLSNMGSAINSNVTNATSKIFGATSKTPSFLGEKASSLAMDTLTDVALDTIPNVANDIYQGKDLGEVTSNMLSNIATNIGFNVGADVLMSGLGKALDKLNFSNPNKEIDDVLSALTDEEKELVEQEAKKQIKMNLQHFAMTDEELAKSYADFLNVPKADDYRKMLLDDISNGETTDIRRTINETISEGNLSNDELLQAQKISDELYDREVAKLVGDDGKLHQNIDGNDYTLTPDDIAKQSDSMRESAKTLAKADADESVKFADALDRWSKKQNMPADANDIIDDVINKSIDDGKIANDIADTPNTTDVSEVADTPNVQTDINNNSYLNKEASKQLDDYKTQRESIINNDEGDVKVDSNTSNVSQQKSNAVSMNQLINSKTISNPKDYKLSQLYTNTLSKMKVANMDNAKDLTASLMGIRHDDQLIKDATKMVESNPNLAEDIINGKVIIDGDTSVIATKVTMDNLRSEIELLKESGATKEEIASIQSKLDLVKIRARNAASEGGRELRAWGLMNDSFDGMVVNTERYMDKLGKQLSTGRTGKKIERVSEELQEIKKGKTKTSNNKNKVNKKTNKKFDKSMDAYLDPDSVKNTKNAMPKSEETIREELRNSFAKYQELSGFTEKDLDKVTELIMKGTPNWKITNLIEERLKSGTWVDLIDDTPVVKVSNSKVDKALRDMGYDGTQDVVKSTKTHEQIVEEVKNSFEKEYADISSKFKDSDYEFVASMVENNIPTWQITDEISHKLSTGDWYTLDESLPIGKPINGKLKSALDGVVGEETEKISKELTIDELKEQVRNTFEKESGSLFNDLTDEDYDFIANLLDNGVTSKELQTMLATRLKNETWGVPDEAIEEANSLFNQMKLAKPGSKKYVELQTQALGILADASLGKASIGEKFDAWRYLAMLGNPKTHIRNIVGNYIFQKVTDISDNMSALMEMALSKTGIDRTKTILTRGDKDLINACKEDAIETSYGALQGNKYLDNYGRQINRNRNIFDNWFVKKMDEVNSKLLDAEDFMAMQTKYKKTLARYLKANGFDESVFKQELEFENLIKKSRTEILTSDERALMNEYTNNVAKLNEGREYAIKQAEYSAFHEDNAFADWLSKFSSKAPKPAQMVMEGIMPFKKTPSNILRSAYDYSPIHILSDINTLRKTIGKDAPKKFYEFLESASKTLTGTGMVALGYYLANKGILHNSEEDTKWQDNLEGQQNYSINLFGHSISIDFAAPSVVPLLLGSEIANMVSDEELPAYDDKGFQTSGENKYNVLEEILQSSSRLFSPVMETSMLSGVNDTLESLSNGAYEDALGNLAISSLSGYGSQAIPTLLGQISRTIDDTRRSTYSSSDSAVIRQLEKYGKKLMNKTPWLSFLNEPYLDAYGREQKNSPVQTGNPVIDYLGNLAYQTGSPSYVQAINQTDVDSELRDVYKNTLDEKVFASSDYKPESTLSFRPDSDMYYDYSKVVGESTYADLEKLFNEPAYQNMDYEQKAEMIKKVYSNAKKKGRNEILGASEEEKQELEDDFSDKLLKQDIENLGPNYNDLTKEAYINNDTETLEKVQKYQEEANKYTYTTSDRKTKTLEITKSMYEDLEKMSSESEKKEYIAYQGKCKELKIDASERGFDAYKKGKIEEFANDYKETLKELGMSDSETAYKEWLKTGSIGLREYASKQKREKAKQESQRVTALENVYGGKQVNNARDMYNKATKYIPKLTEAEWAVTYSQIDSLGKRNGEITQEEMFKYFKKNNKTEEEAQQYWKAYGNWKTIPYLKDGEWKTKKK